MTLTNEHTVTSLWEEFGQILSESDEISENVYKLAELVFFTSAKLSFLIASEAMQSGPIVARVVIEANDALCEKYLAQHDPIN